MHILIVDDDPVCREILAAHCKKSATHHVTLAESGKDAWALLDDPKRWFDLVFLDVTMPNWGGLDVLKRLHESPLHRSTEVVMCTSSNDRTTITDAIALGARHYIVKPCTPEIVAAKLKQIEEAKATAGRPVRAVPAPVHGSARQPA